MNTFIDLTSQTFGRWQVLRWDADGRWICRCQCGVERSVRGCHLRSGASQSCGCYSRDWSREHSRKHGYSQHPLHTRWRHIIRRCFDPRCWNYKRYGGRGITIWPPWRHDAVRFIEDVEREIGPIPFPDAQLDRIDNDGNYVPGNLRWATRSQQQLNQRANRYWTLDGERISLREMAQTLAMKPADLRNRLYRAEQSLVNQKR